MSNRDERTKPTYETPTIVALGALARGAGACTAGTGDADTCTQGGTANTACTAGVGATAGCTAGTILAT